MNLTICNHGYYMHDCALCEKRPGECDWGLCGLEATHLVTYIRKNGAASRNGGVTERRPMCQRHAHWPGTANDVVKTLAYLKVGRS